MPACSVCEEGTREMERSETLTGRQRAYIYMQLIEAEHKGRAGGGDWFRQRQTAEFQVSS